MDSTAYTIAWSIYLVVGVGLTIIFWRFFKKYLWRDLAYLLQGFMIAVIYTPWYVYPDQDYMAPAFIIFMMDTITISAEEGIRALIPLVMAMLFSLLITIGRGITWRVRNRHQQD